MSSLNKVPVIKKYGNKKNGNIFLNCSPLDSSCLSTKNQENNKKKEF